MRNKIVKRKLFVCVVLLVIIYIFGSKENYVWIRRKLRNHLLNDTDGQQNRKANKAQPTKRPWFFKNGQYYPNQATIPNKRALLNGNKLFPDQDPHSDRIINQLMYVPHNYKEISKSGKLKKILVYYGLKEFDVEQGRNEFLQNKCPVDTCELTEDMENATTADMILYRERCELTDEIEATNLKQIKMFYTLESPMNSVEINASIIFNWTATYRRDSDIVAPYEKWQYYDSNVKQKDQLRNYAANKTKKVAWFVSNCLTTNERLAFANNLAYYIDVDIYGTCGKYSCEKSNAEQCFKLLEDYKFYLSFENSNCKEYITEKFFVNALKSNVLPIVMGAQPSDYAYSAPHHSFIHVDEFASPKELAEYLLLLDKNDDLYNLYFKWKGTGEFINTYFWCRVCAALHDEESLVKPRWYNDINDWWFRLGRCRPNSWRQSNISKQRT